MRKLIYGAVTCLMATFLLTGSQFILPIFEPPVTSLTLLNQLAGPPGPSASLLAAPVIYSCSRNFYVDGSTGSNSNNGSQGSPWLTIQHADATALQAGDCVNVVAGTYTGTAWNTPFNPTHGGNLASTTGYITYRCQTLNACKITYAGTLGDNGVIQLTVPYIIFDGFDIDGGEGAVYGGLAKSCIDSSIADTGGSSHHFWILNSKLHGCGLSCIGTSDAEYQMAIHNEMFNCAWNDSNQGSGLGYVIPLALGSGISQYPAYGTPTAQDNQYAPFHFLILWNYIHDNGCTTCLGSSTVLTTTCNTHTSLTLDGCASTAGVAFKQLVTGPLGSSCIQPFTYVNTIVAGTITLSRSETCTQNGLAITFRSLTGGHTDGNGIILDTFCPGAIPASCYPNETLVAFNDVQFNGGRGIHVFGAIKATVANNSMYHNGSDATFAGGIPDLSHQDGSNDNYFNNVAFAVDTINTAACGGPCTNTLLAGDNSGGAGNGQNNVYFNNVFFGSGGIALFQNEVTNYVAANNKGNNDPLYVNETSDVTGTADLHLQGGSPARSYLHSWALMPTNTVNAGAYQ